MRVINESGRCGLYSKILNEGYNDIVLTIENEEIPAVSSILCVSNQRLKSIIKDENADTQIPLPDKITKKAFSLLCEYYGYGVIEVDEENVCELLLCCICLNEVYLLSKCEIYILNHLTDNLVLNILNVIEYIPHNYLEDIECKINDYISLNCISFLNNEEIFKSLHLDQFKNILTLENLLIPNEKYLLEKTLIHYHDNNERIEDKEEKYNEVMKYLNWKEIDIREIEEDDLDIIDMNLIKRSKSQTPIKRKYVRIPSTKIRLLNEMILNGFKDLDSIENIQYEDCEYLLSLDNIKEEISNYLKECINLGEAITTVRIIKMLNIKPDKLVIDNKEKESLIGLLTKECEGNEEEKLIAIECLSYFFDDNSTIEFVSKSSRCKLLTEMLNYDIVEDKSNIIEYIKNNMDENEKQSITDNIDDDDIKQKILPKPPPSPPPPQICNNDGYEDDPYGYYGFGYEDDDDPYGEDLYGDYQYEEDDDEYGDYDDYPF